MKVAPNIFLSLLILILFSSSLYSQKTGKSFEESTLETDFSDRQAIIKTTDFFYR